MIMKFQNLQFKINKSRIVLLCLVFLTFYLLLFTFTLVHAQTTPSTPPPSSPSKPLDYVPLISDSPLSVEKTISAQGLGELVKKYVKIAIQLAGMLAVIMIIVGGIQYVSTDSWSGKSDGKQRIQAALGGLALALASYIILNTINPALTDLNFTIEPVKLTDSTVGIGVDTTPGGGTVPGGGTPTGGGGPAPTGGTATPEVKAMIGQAVSMPITSTYYNEREPDGDEDTRNFRSSTGFPLHHGGQVGVAAVDPNVIPYGSLIIVNGQYFIAVDTGGAVVSRTASKARGNNYPVIDFFSYSQVGAEVGNYIIYPFKGNFMSLSRADQSSLFNLSNYQL